MVRFTIMIYRRAVDELHNQVRSPIFASAAVKDSRYPRMLQISQNLPFLTKTFQHFFVAQLGVDELYRDELFILPVRARGSVNASHAALAEKPQKLIGTDA